MKNTKLKQNFWVYVKKVLLLNKQIENVTPDKGVHNQIKNY